MSNFDTAILAKRKKHQIYSHTIQVNCLHCNTVISYLRNDLKRSSEWRYKGEKNCKGCGKLDVLKIQRF